ncbi:MAG: cytochrome c biogenesis protein CcsA [Candidatus Zixiibacteriota bacterium]
MGPNQPGDLLIIFALACNLVAGIGFLLVATGRRSFDQLAHRGYHLFALFTTLAVAYLYYLFYTDNFAIKYVFEYSERAQPAMYILSAFWGGQEGTYLLWLFFNALFGYILIFRGGQYKYWALAVYSLANLFFLLILVKLSPFALTPQPVADGMGLNPLLRDPWMIIHPPVIFVGYSIAAIPFALAIAALIIKDYSGWLKKAFPWVAISALTLGAGNILGGFWAYKTLGWGGFWAWDPVENSSFVPWVFALALVHGLIVERRSGALRRINLLLASFVFLLVVYGTFLTRSGVLADFSVHSFTDLGINNYLIAFMIVSLLTTLVVFFMRFRSVPTAPMNYNFFGREFSLFSGLVMLCLFGFVVLTWTSLPLLTKLVGAEPRAADVSTYNYFAIPLVILMSALVGVAPFTQYGDFKLEGWMKKAGIAIMVSAAIGFGVFVLALHGDPLFGVIFTLVVSGLSIYLYRADLLKVLIPALAAFLVTIVIAVSVGVHDYLFVLFLATGAFAAVSNIVALIGYLPGRWKLMGGQLTHFGYGMMLIGILASTAFPSSQKVIVEKGSTGEAYGLKFTYQGMMYDIRTPNNEIKLQIDDNGSISDARPQLYYSERMQGTMRKPFIQKGFLNDLYMAPEEVRQAEASPEGIVIAKGETKEIGDLKITFEGFAMSPHGDSSMGGMQVGAKLSVVSHGTTSSVEPAVVHQMDADGHPIQVDSPAEVKGYGDQSYSIHVSRVLADQGAVGLVIPGLTDIGGGERLVLDVSRKPLINLVWTGALLIVLGTIVVFLRRREEMMQSPKVSSETLAQPQSQTAL